MARWRRVLLPLALQSTPGVEDRCLTPASKELFERAVAVAGRAGAELLVSLGAPEGGESASAQTLRLGPLLASAAEQGVTVTVAASTGASFSQFIEASQVDLVCVGREARGESVRPAGAGQFWLSSASPHAGPVPVWQCGTLELTSLPTFLAVDDLTAAGEETLRVAVGAARQMHARLVVLSMIPADSEAADLETSTQQRQAVERTVIARLRDTDYRTIGPGVQVHVRTGVAWPTLAGVVDEFAVECVCLGGSTLSIHLTETLRNPRNPLPFHVLWIPTDRAR